MQLSAGDFLRCVFLGTALVTSCLGRATHVNIRSVTEEDPTSTTITSENGTERSGKTTPQMTSASIEDGTTVSFTELMENLTNMGETHAPDTSSVGPTSPENNTQVASTLELGLGNNEISERGTEIGTKATTARSEDSRQEKRLLIEDPMDEDKTAMDSCHCDTHDFGTFDPSTCIGKRVIGDPGCPCRQRCAQQNGQGCSETNMCDAEFGLTCDKHSNTCQGKLQIQRSETTHNAMVLRWKPSRTEELPQATVMYTTNYTRTNTRWMEAEPKESMVKIDGLQPNTEYFVRIEENGHYEMAVVKTKNGCVVNGTVSFGEGETFNVGCQQTCTCDRNGKTECRQRCEFQPGSITDPSCVEIFVENDPCCVTYHCKDNPVPSTPKVLVTQRTPSSLTIAWDDFKLPNYESGYVVEYRAMHEDKPVDWIPVQGGNIPLLTVTRLKPHTAYQVRVSVWDDMVSRKLGTSSEMVTIYTEDGCVRNNQTYYVGMEFFEGCDLRCACKGDDEGNCKERCSPPLSRAGAEPLEPHCIEVPVGDDPCCVKVQCTQPKSGGLDVADITFSEKPGLCPGEVEIGNSEDCPINCHHDHQCSGNMKCCQSSCGGSLCVEPFTSRNACMHIVCGPNALCINTETKPSCICSPGFSGDPSDLHKGCDKGGATGRSIETCVYNNASYNPGDIFFDDCKYRCECKNNLQVDCTDRCLFTAAKANLTISLCKTVSSTNDPCCEVMKCESSDSDMPVPIKNTLLNSSLEVLSTVDKERGNTNYSFGTTLSSQDENEEDESNSSELPEVDSLFPKSHQTNPMRTKAPFEINMKIGVNDMNEDTLDRKLEVKTHFSMETTVVPNFDKRADLEKDRDNINIEIKKSHKNSSLSEAREKETSMNTEVPLRFNGCEHNNQSYDLGESFKDGCESQCLCDGRGHISCVPRCPYPADIGPKCRKIPDPNDSCCDIIMCDAPGDEKTVQNPLGLAIRLESAKPQNASSVVLRIKFVIPASPADSIQVWYAPFEDNVNADKPVTWTKQKFSLGQLKLLEPHVVEAEIVGLQSSTEYYIKVVKPGMDPIIPVLFSNTVSVKTFPSVVTTSFKGCFNRNKTYDVGEVFFVECEYRCVCHENGLVECRERCDAYIDNLGLEHCQWVPAPDDACCTVPYCKEINPRAPLRPFENPQVPLRQAFCLVGKGEIKTIGSKWEVSDGCQPKICSCELLQNGTTAIECKGGCPPIPSSIQHPTQDCPQPVLVKPEDPCLCPYIVCSNAVNPLSVPMCEHQSRQYHVGEEFYDGCHAVCHCGRDLKVNCAAIECPKHFVSHANECHDLEEDPNFIPSPPNCCPQPKCKVDLSCLLNGHRFGNFQPIPQEFVDCSARCICIQGNVTCENRCQPISDVPPHNLPCSSQMAYQGHLPGDTCCLHWMCRQQENGGHDLQHVNIISLNSTTIRVRFTLPPVMVGLMGHAELHFTTDPSVPRSAWHVQKFARPKRLFDTPNIEYYMFGLRPDTIYFFQVFITVEALQKGPESKVFKLKMPPLATAVTTVTTEIPVETSFNSITVSSVKSTDSTTIATQATSTTSMTTTTTYPPMMMLDPALSVTDIHPSSARVSWRAFGLKEKRYIDGFRLKYKTASEKDSLWMTTPMIHRDVKSYVIRDLKPGTSYMMDLQFVTPEDIPTHLMSSNPIEMRTGDLPKDEYNFHVAFQKSKVGPYGCEISLVGIPLPLSKYVHVVRATYKTEADAEQSQVFKIPKNNNIVLENLKPGHRYKVWLDLYLTNGNTLSADVIEFLTNAAPPESQTSNVQTGNSAEALQITHDNAENEAYYVALIVVAIVAAVAGVGFVVVLIILMRKQSSAKAPITRSPSESAYDNPTYKTYDGERSDDKNGTIQP